MKKWILLITSLPTAIGIINIYLKIEVPHIPLYVSLPILAMGFLIASYQIFKEDNQQIQILKDKLSSPTKYEITAMLTPIDGQLDQKVSALKKQKNEAQKLYDAILKKRQKLEELKRKTEFSSTSKLVSSLTSPFSAQYKVPLSVMVHLEQQTKSIQKQVARLSSHYTYPEKSYEQAFEEYEEKLLSIINNYKQNIEELKEKTKKLEESYCFITFKIKNIGTISDEKINIMLNFSQSQLFYKRKIAKLYIQLASVKSAIPDEPQEKDYQPKPISHLDDFDFMHKIKDFSHIQTQSVFATRQDIEFEDNSAEITIKDMNVGEELDIFNKSLIIKWDKTSSITSIIKSKNATAVQESIVNIKNQDKKQFFELK